MEFSLDNTEKVISLIAGIIAIVTFLFLRNRRMTGDVKNRNKQENISNNTQTVTVNLGSEGLGGFAQPIVSAAPVVLTDSIPNLKKTVRILFIDDDKGFKIVGVLKKMGWEHTKIVGDIGSLEQTALVEAHVVFVDIQGVGKSMHYIDEGLGLALAIKRRYQDKKVIIYSAQEEGARFHEALQEADYSLPKHAEPIRFEDTIVKVMTK